MFFHGASCPSGPRVYIAVDHPASYPWPMSPFDRPGLVQGESDARQSCLCTSVFVHMALLCRCNTNSNVVCFTKHAAFPGTQHNAAAAQELRTRLCRCIDAACCGRVSCLRVSVSHQLRQLWRRALAHRCCSTGAPARSGSCHARARSSRPLGCSSPAGCGAARATQRTMHTVFSGAAARLRSSAHVPAVTEALRTGAVDGCAVILRGASDTGTARAHRAARTFSTSSG